MTVLLRFGVVHIRRNFAPSIIPSGDDETVYLVLDDFGRLGRPFCETDVERANLETTIGDLMSSQYSGPVAVIAFNVAEGWSSDVSEAIAREINRRAELAGDALPSSIAEFVAGRARVQPVSERQALGTPEAKARYVMTDPKKDACEPTENKRGLSKQSREAERQRFVEEYVMDLREILKRFRKFFQLKAGALLDMRSRSIAGACSQRAT